MVETIDAEVLASWPEGRVSYKLQEGNFNTGMLILRTGRVLAMRIVLDTFEENGEFNVLVVVSKGRWKQQINENTELEYKLTECEVMQTELGAVLDVKGEKQGKLKFGESERNFWEVIYKPFRNFSKFSGDKALSRCIQQFRMSFSEEADDIHPLEKVFGYRFKNECLLIEALTTPAFKNENKDAESYQRLEYLGDGVLRLGLRMLLLEHHSDYSESELSRAEAWVGSNAYLCDLGVVLGLNNYIRFGSFTDVSRYKKTYADVIESILGAITVDGGFECAAKAVRKLFEDEIKKPIGERSNMVSLHERAGKEKKKIEYITSKLEDCEEHNREYKAICLVDGIETGFGKATSSKAAKHKAAEDAYTKLYIET